MGEHTGSDSMVVQPAHLRLNVCSSSTAGAKEDCILCLFEECSSADIGIDIVLDGMCGIGSEQGCRSSDVTFIGSRDSA